MKNIQEKRLQFTSGEIDKATYIRDMYNNFHSKLFDYSFYLQNTNIKRIEIEDQSLIMTTRNRGIKIICESGDFRIAPIEILNFIDYELEDSNMMENLFSDGDTFFDIGANIGWYAINMAISKLASTIYCFEPIPKTFRSLINNININGLLNVKPYNFGFSSRSGDFNFYYYPEGSGNASSANLTGRNDVQSVKCKVLTLDEFSAKNGAKVDFIKCDVEGAELMVFQGGAETILRDKPIVFSEILRKWSAKFHYDPNDIFKMFTQFGYQAFTAAGGRLKPFSRMNELTLETNFFFLHGEKHSRLINEFSL